MQNGREQVNAMAKLLNPDQRELDGWRVGDLADVQGLGRVQVARLVPPSEIVVRTKAGASARVRARALQRVRP
jgi:hypothetical protein